MRQFAQSYVLAFWMAGSCVAQTVPAPPASSASPGGAATAAVTAVIENNEFGSIYPPAWTTYFYGQTRISSANGSKLSATIRDDGRIAISGVKTPMPVPVGKSWTYLDMRNNCLRGYTYSAWPVFTAEQARDGTRPRQWAWEEKFQEGKCAF